MVAGRAAVGEILVNRAALVVSEKKTQEGMEDLRLAYEWSEDINISEARIVGTPPTNQDAWCVNGSNGHVGGSITGAEVCVDASGNVVPTVTNAQTLGSSSLAFSQAYIATVNAVASLSAGLLQLTRTVVTLNTATQIPLTTSFENLVSATQNSNTNLTLTATPTIPTAGVASGTILVLSNLATPTFRIQDAGTLTGSGVQLASAGYRQIGQYQTLTLIYDNADGFWREIAFGSN
jgi:hypothetical protein